MDTCMFWVELTYKQYEYRGDIRHLADFAFLKRMHTFNTTHVVLEKSVYIKENNPTQMYVLYN